MSENIFFKPPIPQESGVNSEAYTEFIESHLHDLTLNASESGGFLYFPADHIKIIPPQENTHHSAILEITEPEVKQGLEQFQQRDIFEKNYPVQETLATNALENKIFQGEIVPATTLQAETGARVCFYTVKIYETKDGQFISMPILPQTDQKYESQSKLGGGILMKGNQKLANAKSLLSATASREQSFLQDEIANKERSQFIKQGNLEKTGLWTLRIRDKKGGFSDIRHCHIAKDIETGTLDVFITQKHLLFTHQSDIATTEHIPNATERLHALVSLQDLKSAQEGQALPLSDIFSQEGKRIHMSEIPQQYKGLFEQKDDVLFLRSFKATPPLKAFLDNERRMIEPDTSDMLQEAIREKIGHFFEEVLEKIMHTEKNTREISFVAPQKNTLHTLPHNLPVEFYNWVNTVAGKTLTVQPDFILPDGTFLEAKSGGKTYVKPKKREQLFRMMLYKITRQKPLSSIRYITLDTHDATDIPIPEIRYESIFESEWKHTLQESDFKTIRQWQSRLTS